MNGISGSQIEQGPGTPDLAPVDHHLFRSLQRHMSKKRPYKIHKAERYSSRVGFEVFGIFGLASVKLIGFPWNSGFSVPQYCRIWRGEMEFKGSTVLVVEGKIIGVFLQTVRIYFTPYLWSHGSPKLHFTPLNRVMWWDLESWISENSDRLNARETKPQKPPESTPIFVRPHFFQVLRRQH